MGLVQEANVFGTLGAGISLLEYGHRKGEMSLSPVVWGWNWTDRHEEHRVSWLGIARPHGPECHQLPGCALRLELGAGWGVPGTRWCQHQGRKA